MLVCVIGFGGFSLLFLFQKGTQVIRNFSVSTLQVKSMDTIFEFNVFSLILVTRDIGVSYQRQKNYVYEHTLNCEK